MLGSIGAWFASPFTVFGIGVRIASPLMVFGISVSIIGS